MREYQLQETKEIRKLTKIICNKCGKEIPVSEGYPKKGVFRAEQVWEYFSDKDGETHRFDLCESCYDEWIGSFCIPVEIEV